jgi:hypothetical protein
VTIGHNPKRAGQAAAALGRQEEHPLGGVVVEEEVEKRAEADLEFGRIVVPDIAAPNMLANMVWSGSAVVRSDSATEPWTDHPEPAGHREAEDRARPADPTRLSLVEHTGCIWWC